MHPLNNLSELTVICAVAFFAVLNTGFWLVADKFKIVRYYELHRKTWMPEKCEFCTFFWMAVVELLTWYFILFPFDWVTFISVFALALCAAVLSRFFL